MSRRKSVWIILGVLVVVVAAGGAYYYFRVRPAQAAQAAAAQAPTLSTGAVTRGDLVISASGSGMLVPAHEMEIGFQTSGTLKELLVKLGDVVEAGQTLAVLDDTDLRNAVTEAEINLRLAQISLDTLTESADASEVASAQASLASAKDNAAKLTAAPDSQALLAARESLNSAQQQLAKLLVGPDPDEVKTAQYALENAKNSLWSQQVSRDAACGGNDHVKCDQAQASVGNGDAAVRKAQEDLDAALAGPSADEISDARAKVASARSSLNSLQEKPSVEELAAAEAQVTKAQGDLDALLAGATPAELEKAKLSVQQAQMALDGAKRNLARATLIAPIAGTVTSLTAQVGDAVGSAAIITLSDLAQPQLQFWVEETDMASAVPGNAVNIVFEALPDYTFPGRILSVEPVLVSESNTTAVQAVASLDLGSHPFKVLSGMNAEVEVIAGEARNALLVPVEALRELAPDQYAVFIIQPDGEQVLRPVQVGLKDLVNAEIISGLQEGETISLGTAQRTSTSSQTNGNQQRPPGFPGGGPDIMIFEGGSGGRAPGGAR